MSDGVAATQAFYGRWARLYDRVATLPGVRSWRRRAVAALDLEPGDTVVEMGCGTGANLPFLRDRVGPSGRVVGVDLTRGMLATAGTRIDVRGWANVAVVQGDATAPPLADGADAVLASFVVGMLGDPAAAVETWAASLEPGGRLALLDAAPTRWLPARPLNVPFAAFVWLGTPSKRSAPAAPSRLLAERVAVARAALREATTDARTETAALGFVRLASGARPAE